MFGLNYPFDLKSKAPIIPKTTAAEIPELVISNIPVKTPTTPCVAASFNAPLTS